MKKMTATYDAKTGVFTAVFEGETLSAEEFRQAIGEFAESFGLDAVFTDDGTVVLTDPDEQE